MYVIIILNKGHLTLAMVISIYIENFSPTTKIIYTKITNPPICLNVGGYRFDSRSEHLLVFSKLYFVSDLGASWGIPPFFVKYSITNAS